VDECKPLDAGISVCCGGILGLGEAQSDRASLMKVLANLPEHPESVPINALVPVKGTPMEHLESPSGLEMVRAIAVARIVMPMTVVRLSAGRVNMSPSDQAMCFLAGANSVFTGDKLLTTKNNEKSEDDTLMEELGLVGRPAFVPYLAGAASSDGSEWTEEMHVSASIREGAERAVKQAEAEKQAAAATA
jgi:biotin synthase